MRFPPKYILQDGLVYYCYFTNLTRGLDSWLLSFWADCGWVWIDWWMGGGMDGWAGNLVGMWLWLGWGTIDWKGVIQEQLFNYLY